jgi:hypothetical protein
MEIARTIYSGITANRLAVTTGVLGVAAFPTMALLLRLPAPEPKACKQGIARACVRGLFHCFVQLSAGAFAYRWHPACTLLPLSLFGLHCIAFFGPQKNSAGKKLPHLILGTYTLMLEYFAVIGHLTAAARGLGGSNRFFKIAAMAVAGVGQAALTIIGFALFAKKEPEIDEEG